MEMASGEDAPREHQFCNTGIELLGRTDEDLPVALVTVVIAPEILHGRDVHHVDYRKVFEHLEDEPSLPAASLFMGTQEPDLIHAGTAAIASMAKLRPLGVFETDARK